MHINNYSLDEIKNRLNTQGIESLTKDELTFLINYELSFKDDSELDLALIELCTTQLTLMDINANHIIEKQKIDHLFKKATRQKHLITLTKTASVIAAIIFIVIPINCFATAYGFNILDRISEWGTTIKNIPFGQQINENNISVEKDSLVILKSINELERFVDESFLFLDYMPEGIILESIHVMEEEIHFIFNQSYILFSLTHDDTINKAVIEASELYEYNSIKYYINTSNYSIEAIWAYNGDLYTLNYPNKDELIKMIKYLIIKESSK